MGLDGKEQAVLMFGIKAAAGASLGHSDSIMQLMHCYSFCRNFALYTSYLGVALMDQAAAVRVASDLEQVLWTPPLYLVGDGLNAAPLIDWRADSFPPSPATGAQHCRASVLIPCYQPDAVVDEGSWEAF